MVQLHASGQPSLGEKAQLRDDELIELFKSSSFALVSPSSPQKAMHEDGEGTGTHLLGYQMHG